MEGLGASWGRERLKLGRGMIPFLGSSMVRVLSEVLEEERRVGDSGRYQAWLELRLLLGTSRVAAMRVYAVYANVMRVGVNTSDIHHACSCLVYSRRCVVGHRDLYCIRPPGLASARDDVR